MSSISKTSKKRSAGNGLCNLHVAEDPGIDYIALVLREVDAFDRQIGRWVVQIMIDEIEHFREVGDVAVGVGEHEVGSLARLPECVSWRFRVDYLKVPRLLGEVYMGSDIHRYIRSLSLSARPFHRKYTDRSSSQRDRSTHC